MIFDLLQMLLHHFLRFQPGSEEIGHEALRVRLAIRITRRRHDRAESDSRVRADGDKIISPSRQRPIGPDIAGQWIHTLSAVLVVLYRGASLAQFRVKVVA